MSTTRTGQVRVDKLRVGDFLMEAVVNGTALGIRGDVKTVTQTAWLPVGVGAGIYVIELTSGVRLSRIGYERVYVEREV